MLDEPALPDTEETLAAAAVFEAEDTDWRVAWTDHEMVAVHQAVAHLREAQEALDAAVATAREAGRSWEAVATATGMTRQGATKRWSRPVQAAS